ncbi:metallophosphoesterase family protein [Cesiribacter andamanensis]|uniref:Nuclease SbcCD subunit D n=1 Tax=Cesiribacter andamanensis AMV16 TaxID=1279009 RepID=M7N4A8_9BACT|nr:exonuclease subunit SbcD [Cesiribacter andamanensis]EMR02051.1 Nuclease sbcCD subunit D [Cesiribacter andamanensis AMV16]
MKLLHTADWHLGKRLQTYSRLEEQREVMDEICRIADEQQVDVVLIAGDLYDTFSPPNEAIELFYKTLHRLAAGGKRAVIGIAGNHDSPDRINAPDPLARACGIILCGRPLCVVKECAMEGGMELLRSEPGFAELRIPGYDYPLRLLLTPYASEATLRQYLGEEEREEELRRLLQEHWQQLADRYCDEQGVNMLMTHLFVTDQHNPQPEDEGDGERPILHMGGAQAIFTQNMPAQLQYVALGHLHRYQIVSKAPCPVVYSSSPLAYSFSEAHQPKFVVLLEAEPGQPVKMKPLCLKSGRSLERKRFEGLEEALQWLQENPHTYVELTLVCDTYLDGKTRKALLKAHDGIVTIIPEARISPEEIEKKSLMQRSGNQSDMTELFKEYFISRKGQEPSADMLSLFKEVLDDKG